MLTVDKARSGVALGHEATREDSGGAATREVPMEVLEALLEALAPWLEVGLVK